MPIFSKAEDLFGHIKEYVNNRIDSAKLDIADKTSRISANAIAVLIIVLLSLFFILFASIALAQVIGEWIGKSYWGFLIVAGIYLLLAFIIRIGKNKLLRLPIMNAILRQLFNDNDHEQH